MPSSGVQSMALHVRSSTGTQHVQLKVRHMAEVTCLCLQSHELAAGLQLPPQQLGGGTLQRLRQSRVLQVLGTLCPAEMCWWQGWVLLHCSLAAAMLVRCSTDQSLPLCILASIFILQRHLTFTAMLSMEKTCQSSSISEGSSWHKTRAWLEKDTCFSALGVA